MRLRGNKLLRKVDRYIGIPVIFFLGCLHKKQRIFQISQEPRIVLLKTNAIGDAILLSAVIQELRAQYPNAYITIICGKTNQALVKLIEGVDEIFCFAMGSPFKALLAVRALGRFDLLFDFGPWMRINALIAASMRVSFKVGFKRHGMYRHYIYDAVAEHRDDQHEMDNYRDILRSVGIIPKGFLPYFSIEDKAAKDNYVVFHLFPGGSMQRQRKWPMSRWCKLGRIIASEMKSKIYISGGREDIAEAQLLCDDLHKNGVFAEVLAGKKNLKEMCDILHGASVVVSVNTGIMHLGAAVGAKLVALHGAIDPQRWGPLTDGAVVLQSGDPCQPCLSLGFEHFCNYPICMEHISVEQVWKAVQSLLGKENFE